MLLNLDLSPAECGSNESIFTHWVMREGRLEDGGLRKAVDGPTPAPREGRGWGELSQAKRDRDGMMWCTVHVPTTMAIIICASSQHLPNQNWTLVSVLPAIYRGLNCFRRVKLTLYR
jgi:hypothetical protein